ncbi:hypothetical protein PR003_g25061, partial [Phytophthora rubi]
MIDRDSTRVTLLSRIIPQTTCSRQQEERHGPHGVVIPNRIGSPPQNQPESPPLSSTELKCLAASQGCRCRALKKKALYRLRHASASNTQHIYGGAGAISRTGKPIASTTIAGTQWSVYKGPNGSMMVYSFVACKQVENFEGDLMEFFNYLVMDQGFKTSQFLIKVECGTEPFVGNDVTMTVSKYSATVNTSGGSSTPTQSGDSSSSTEQTTTAPATSRTGSSAEQTTPAPADPFHGLVAGSSEEQTPSTGSSTEQTTDAPAASNADSSEEAPSSGSSEETPVESSTGSSVDTPATSDAGSVDYFLGRIPVCSAVWVGDSNTNLKCLSMSSEASERPFATEAK